MTGYRHKMQPQACSPPRREENKIEEIKNHSPAVYEMILAEIKMKQNNKTAATTTTATKPDE